MEGSSPIGHLAIVYEDLQPVVGRVGTGDSRKVCSADGEGAEDVDVHDECTVTLSQNET